MDCRVSVAFRFLKQKENLNLCYNIGQWIVDWKDEWRKETRMPAVMERNEWVDTMAHASCASRVWLETVRPKRNRISFSAPISHKGSAFRIVVIPLTDANDSSLVSDSLEMDVLKSTGVEHEGGSINHKN